jgi:hypothetical protein
MQNQVETEVLIVRNTCINRLYDVVRVDFTKEEVEYLAKALEYVDAVGLKTEIESIEENN